MDHSHGPGKQNLRCNCSNDIIVALVYMFLFVCLVWAAIALFLILYPSSRFFIALGGIMLGAEMMYFQHQMNRELPKVKNDK